MQGILKTTNTRIQLPVSAVSTATIHTMRCPTSTLPYFKFKYNYGWLFFSINAMARLPSGQVHKQTCCKDIGVQWEQSGRRMRRGKRRVQHTTSTSHQIEEMPRIAQLHKNMHTYIHGLCSSKNVCLLAANCKI